MSFPAYQNYQESGKRWLGNLPESWRVVPFWTLFQRVKRTGFPEHELLSVYRDYGVIRKRDRDDNFNKPSEDLSAYQLVEVGDLAINKMKAWQGSLGVSPHTGIVSPAYFVYRARHEQVPAYLHYLLRSDPYAVGLMTISKGIRINQWDVDPDHLAQLPVPLPSIPEQTAIAAFLDRETAKIDTLVEEQRRLIELLKEKRQAVISHAVTKGLDPTVPMKDSGVEWLGQVPAHWEVLSIRRFAVSVQTGTTPSNEPASSDVEHGLPWYTPGDFGQTLHLRTATKRISEDCAASGEARLFAPRSVLVVGIGATLGRVGYVTETSSANQQINAILPDSTVDPRFLTLSLTAQSEVMKLLSNASTIGIMNQDRTKDLIVARPPLDEQQQAVAYLADALSKFDLLARGVEEAIALFQERRAALISAAVTGKIDVRGAAAQQMEAA